MASAFNEIKYSRGSPLPSVSLSICTCRQRSSSQKLESGLAEAHAGSGVARTVEAKGSEVHVNYAKANLEDLISPVKASLHEAETEASNTECSQSQFKLKSAPSRQDFVCSFRHESYTSEPSVRAAGAGRVPADEYCPRGNVRIASVSILAQTMQLTFVSTSPSVSRHHCEDDEAAHRYRCWTPQVEGHSVPHDSTRSVRR